jgi:CHAD domain-containing protein
VEIEAKYRVPGEQQFQRLLGVTSLAGFDLGTMSVADLHDTYLDTAGRAILAGGYACRLRRQGDRIIATLKGLGRAEGAVHRRVELEVELTEPLAPQGWPASAARDLALSLAGQEHLVPLFRLVQIRHSRSMARGNRIVAELHLDRVRVLQGDAVAATYLELEAELTPDGREEDLDRLAAELDEWQLEPESRSKFQRALALSDSTLVPREEEPRSVEPHLAPEHAASLGDVSPGQGAVHASASVELLNRPGIEPDDPMSEAGRKTLRFHFRRMLYNEPGTRLGEDIEALHDMRVATRRMRAAFRVFDHYYKPKAVAPYIKGLKRTGRALGAVRDLDVFRAKIQAYLETLPAADRDSLDDLLVALEVQREAARERMLFYFDGKKYRRFVEGFGRFVETEGMGSQPVTLDGGKPWPYRVRHVAPVAIYERLAAVRAYDEWVTIPDPPLERLHALRIACKRLRYSLEYFGEVLGPDTKAVIREIVALQDHLGDLQDAVVASAILRDFLLWGTWGADVAGSSPPTPDEPIVAPGVAAYLAAKQSELYTLVETFPQAWQQLTGSGFSRMVAEAVAVL